jgi:hypothetical protein
VYPQDEGNKFLRNVCEHLSNFARDSGRNTAIRRDLQIPTVKEEIRRYSSQYSAGLSAYQMT